MSVLVSSKRMTGLSMVNRYERRGHDSAIGGPVIGIIKRDFCLLIDPEVEKVQSHWSTFYGFPYLSINFLVFICSKKFKYENDKLFSF